MKRTIIIGDVHGCYEELCELIEKLRIDWVEDRLIFVGDLVDRGPEPIKVIQMLRALKAECTVGNHDERYLRYRKHMKRKAEDPSYVIPMQAPYGGRMAMFESLTEEDWAWLESLPIHIRIDENWVVIHAGLEPGLRVEKQDPGVVLHGRYIRKSTGRMERVLSNISASEACVWPELWDGRDNIIYGHMVTQTRMPVINLSPSGALCVGIDTGCCFGGALTAMILLEDGYSFTFQSVKARQQYEDDAAGYIAATTLR